jgi:hypothetical protein
LISKNKNKMLNERKLSKAEEKRKEEIVKDLKSNKREFVKRYGKDAESVMYGTAVKRAKKQVEEMNQNKIKEAVKAALMKKESVKERDEYFEPEDYADLMALQDATAMMDAIEDLYKKAKALGYGPDVKKLVADLDEELKNPEKADLNKDGELSSYEEKRGAAIEKAMSEKNLKEINREPVKVGDRVGNTVQGFNFIVKKIDGDHLIVQDLNTRTLKKTFIDNMYKYQPPVKEEEGKAILPKTTPAADVAKLTDQGVDVELRNEDLDLGEEDNEPHMIKGELYRIGKYAMELYQMVDKFEYGYGEVDFPAWWQAMITDAASKMVKAKHYLDFEIKEPQIDAMVNVASAEEVIDEEEISAEEKLAALITKALKNAANKDASDQSNLKQARAALNKGNMDAAKKIADPYLEEGLPKGYWAKKIPGGKMDESYEALVKKIKGQGKSEKAAKAIAGAVASYKAKGGGKGPTAKQKK